MTQATNATLAKLRSHLRRQGTDLEAAGDEGENLTRILLDEKEVGWFQVEQGKTTKGTALKSAGAKRVDFVIGSNGASLLLDSKCQGHQAEEDGSIVFKLELSEVKRLRSTGALFGLDVAVIFWSRTSAKATFVVDMLDRLSEAAKIRDPATNSEKKALLARFREDEICELEWT